MRRCERGGASVARSEFDLQRLRIQERSPLSNLAALEMDIVRLPGSSSQRLAEAEPDSLSSH